MGIQMETENNDRTDCVFLILVVNFEKMNNDLVVWLNTLTFQQKQQKLHNSISWRWPNHKPRLKINTWITSTNTSMHLHAVCSCATTETKMPLLLFLSTHSRPPQTLCSWWACARLSCPRLFSLFITLTIFRLAFLSSNWSPCQPRPSLTALLSAKSNQRSALWTPFPCSAAWRAVKCTKHLCQQVSFFYFLKAWRVNVVIVREVIWFLLKVYVHLRSIFSGVLFLCLFSWKIEKVE